MGGSGTRIRRYVALLRGINVGGKNVIKMADLRNRFEAAGYTQVSTYIQSGNVFFDAAAAAPAVTAALESTLSRAFHYSARVIVRERRQVRRVVESAPAGFGAEPDRFRYDVAFLADGLDAAAALPHVPQREGIDSAWAGDGVLYFRRLASAAGSSYLSKLVAMPMYKDMTLRNWRTTNVLLERL